MRTDYIEDMNKFKNITFCIICYGHLKNNYNIHGYQEKLLEGSIDYVELIWSCYCLNHRQRGTKIFGFSIS